MRGMKKEKLPALIMAVISVAVLALMMCDVGIRFITKNIIYDRMSIRSKVVLWIVDGLLPKQRTRKRMEQSAHPSAYRHGERDLCQMINHLLYPVFLCINRPYAKPLRNRAPLLIHDKRNDLITLFWQCRKRF